MTWTPDPHQPTNIAGQDSPDIQYDPIHNHFAATWVLNMFTTRATLVRAFSADGLNWSQLQAVINADSFPSFTNNAGASADDAGHVLPSPTIVRLGQPYSQANIDAGRWDLDGVLLDPP